MLLSKGLNKENSVFSSYINKINLKQLQKQQEHKMQQVGKIKKKHRILIGFELEIPKNKCVKVNH